jgi:23S rRNA pseudouridine955/2504/2580 synthase
MSDARVMTVGADDDGIRLDRWFQRHVPEFGFGAVARAARTGQIRLDGKRVDPGDRVATGQSVRVPPVPPAKDGAAVVRPLSDEDRAYVQGLVIHRDPHAIVLNKPPGLATQGGTGTFRHVDGLLDGLRFEASGRPKLVHRLDKDTSGVLLLARSARAAAHFSKEFSGRAAKKVYWALVVGSPSLDAGMIEAPLAKQPGSGGEKMHVDTVDGLPARTRFRVIDRAGPRAAFVEFQPLTGRTHQIRVHAAAMGHPIVGDGKYGLADAFLTGGISRKLHLHARRLVIGSVDGESVDVCAALPEHFADSLTMLGFDAADGDRLPIDEVKFRDTPEGAARHEAAQAKQRRLARRGERRTRGEREQ